MWVLMKRPSIFLFLIFDEEEELTYRVEVLFDYALSFHIETKIIMMTIYIKNYKFFR